MDIKDRVLVVEDDKSIRNFPDNIGSQQLRRYYGKHRSGSIQYGDFSVSGSGDPGSGTPGYGRDEDIEKYSGMVAMPILVVSARTHERDKVEALDAGVGDYITKPFGTSELLARIRTAIRHARTAYLMPEGMQTGIFHSGGLTIDYDKHRVYVDGKDANLTQNEYKLVSLLGKYAGKVLTYDYIIKEIWGPNMKNDNRILRVNMANIRRKIEKNPGKPEYIFTEVGVGYRIVDPD